MPARARQPQPPIATPPAPPPAVFDLARALARMLAAEQFAADNAHDLRSSSEPPRGEP